MRIRTFLKKLARTEKPGAAQKKADSVLLDIYEGAEKHGARFDMNNPVRRRNFLTIRRQWKEIAEDSMPKQKKVK